ncbi:Inactive peptidyl-prolyl cis-trans isomerase FKBP6 [Armadillidium vulgare]|nr:Inactive peptidyl-prolyl cis-trans isomerase FKBP6 [Armadillidium vulgare]
MDYKNEVENSLLQDGVKLKKATNILDFYNGTVFEVEDCGSPKVETINNFPGSDEDFCDPLLLNSLSGVSNKLKGNNQTSLSDEEEDMEPFEKLAIMMEDISGDEGVLKMELGVGVGPDIPREAQVVFHYSAYLEYADEPFDSTLLRNQPQRAYLNEEDTLPGIKIGLRTMRTKEKARIPYQTPSMLLVSDFGFNFSITKKLGCPPRIPPKATILYEITLLDWNDRSGADTFENLNYEQKVKLSFQQKMKAATDYHKEGNEFYKKNHLLKAKKELSKGNLDSREHECFRCRRRTTTV